MKANEIREMSVENLRARLEELVTERFNLRFRSATESITPRPPPSLGSGKPPTSYVNFAA